MSRAAAGQPIASCRAALVPMAQRRYLPSRDDTHNQLLARAYAGLASYAQYLDASETLDKTSDDSKKELSDEITTRMKSYARDALENWDGLVDVPGVWDVFIVKQVLKKFFLISYISFQSLIALLSFSRSLDAVDIGLLTS